MNELDYAFEIKLSKDEVRHIIATLNTNAIRVAEMRLSEILEDGVDESPATIVIYISE